MIAYHFPLRFLNVATFTSKSDTGVTAIRDEEVNLLNLLVAQLVRAAES